VIFLSISRHTMGCFVPYVMIVSYHTNPSNSVSHCILVYYWLTNNFVLIQRRTCESLRLFRRCGWVLFTFGMKLHRSVIDSRRFEGTFCLYLQESRVPWKWRHMFFFFETSGTDCPVYTITLLYLISPWLAPCGRWNFLRDTGVVRRIIYSFHYCFMYLFVFEV
jgi:hypothetical protein